MMRRSTVGCIVTLTLSILMAPLAADAQPAGKVHRIGVLDVGAAANTAGFLEVVRQGLREHGWVEGQNIVFESRWTERDYARLADLAAELVRLKVDVIVARTTRAARAAQQATQTIPIVMTSGDPVGTGVVSGLARPAENVTGVSGFQPDLVGKRLELLKELVPGLTRVAVLWDAEGPASVLEFQEAKAVAPGVGVQLHSWEVRGPQPDLEGVFQATATGPVGAVLILGSSLFTGGHLQRIVELVVQHRLPAMYNPRGFVTAGGLIAYGPTLTDSNRRMAYYVDRILKGAKPAELPVEQPTRFYLTINLKSARVLGLTIPPHILVLADEVIQ